MTDGRKKEIHSVSVHHASSFYHCSTVYCSKRVLVPVVSITVLVALTVHLTFFEWRSAIFHVILPLSLFPSSLEMPILIFTPQKGLFGLHALRESPHVRLRTTCRLFLSRTSAVCVERNRKVLFLSH